MKKSIKTIVLVLVAILGFLFLPPFFSWTNGNSFEIPTTEIRYAILIVLLTPLLIWLSTKIKSNTLFVVVAIAIIGIAGFLLNIVFTN